MQAPKALGLGIAVIGQCVGKRRRRRVGVMTVQRRAGFLGAGYGKSAQPRQSGDEQAEKNRCPRHASGGRGAEPNSSPAQGDEKSRDNGGGGERGGQALDQQRAPGEEGQAA